MAAKRKPAVKRKTNTKKRSATRKKSEQNDELKLEIILCVLLAIAVLLCISNFGLGGFVGDAVSSVLFGFFGILAYLFPLLLFGAFAFYIANRTNDLVVRKLVGTALFYLFLCAFFQLIMEGFEQGMNLVDLYVISSQDKTGGGLFGGLILTVFHFAFGTVGAYILIVISLIISTIIMTQRPLLRNIGEHGNRAIKNARSERLKRKEELTRLSRDLEEALKASSADEKEDETAQQINNKKDHARDASHTMRESDMTPAFTIQREKTFSVQEDDTGNQAAVIPEKTEAQPVQSERQSLKRTRSSDEDIASGINDIKNEIETKETAKPDIVYQYPPLNLLKKGTRKAGGDSDQHLRETAAKLQQTLRNFGVNVTVTNASCGPTVTRYELQPEQGVKVSRIVSLTDDIKLNLAAPDIRIEAPIPGKAAVGIEVPNGENTAVMLRDLLQTESFQHFPSKLAFAAGKDISGQPVITDIAKMPHLLIAGATGSGKSVCINTIIMSILYKADPKDVKLIMIDPKVVELSVYNGIPHLFIPVVTDPKKAAGALNWAVAEMTERYNLFAEYNVRDLKGYNARVEELQRQNELSEDDMPKKKPQIVIIVDELADLMMVAPSEVEDAICRLAQLARAAGLHLIIATQRPSVNVITGLIKANMPSRIAFAVSSGVDSRTILDMNGAEKLLGKGDMLFYPQNYQKPVRLQGSFVSDKEVSDVVHFLRKHHGEANYDTSITDSINSNVQASEKGGVSASSDEHDAYFVDAGKFIIDKDKASIGMLQRVFKIGFNRAARIMDQLCDAGVVGEEEGTKPRKVLMSMEEFEQYIEESV